MDSPCRTIDRAQELVRALCHQHDLAPAAAEHLQRALAHLSEAWIAANGSRAQTVQEVARNCERSEKLATWFKEATGDQDPS